jgi:hypothetical protein
VNLAARLQANAEPGAVWLAETTFLSMNKNEVQAFEVGARVFKGIAGEVKVYRVLDDCIDKARLLTAAELDRALAATGGKMRTSRRRALLVLVGMLAAGVATFAVMSSWRDSRSPRERFESDPDDLASADEWFESVASMLYDAEDNGSMQSVYREGTVADWIREHGPRLGERPSFVKMTLVFRMANEPPAPGVAELVVSALARYPDLRADPRLCKLLRATRDYAAKEPAQQAVYQRALQLAEGR